MGLVGVIEGPAPGSPPSMEQPCAKDKHVYLTIRVVNYHLKNYPVMKKEGVSITVGGDARRVTTDDNGLVTFVYDAGENIGGREIKVELVDDKRKWKGADNTDKATASGQVYSIAIPVRGRITVNLKVKTRKPGIADPIGWKLPWSPGLKFQYKATPANGNAIDTQVALQPVSGADASAVSSSPLDCVTVHQLKVPLKGFIADRSKVTLKVDGSGDLTPGDAEATSGALKYQKLADNGVQFSVELDGAVVDVEFLFIFPQLMIVGEGTYFEYAVGLATKHGNAQADPGWKWVVATQYDVTAVDAVPTDMEILDWSAGNRLQHQNQRKQIQDAQAKNLIVHGAQFNALDSGHWDAAGNTYGAFDAVMFNNPHPGYGMHMCSLFGLVAGGGIRFKNGRCISVYSIGLDAALSQVQLRPFFRNGATPRPESELKSSAHQRWFVRDHLGHANAADTAVPLQYNPGDSQPRALQIRDGFQYEDGSAIDARAFGTAGEFTGYATDFHYRSRVDTIGLHEYLMRCYRHYGSRVLKRGGRLFIDGSDKYNGILTQSFRFGATTVPAMTNGGNWNGTDYFAWYRTNFTSTDHHPSWYSDVSFSPGEPSLRNARYYYWQKP